MGSQLGWNAGGAVRPAPLEKLPPFARLLRHGRQTQRRSQLDLALEAGVSQRHLSFLESGRARPSQPMVLQLAEALELPLRERNDWLTAAGFAPHFPERALEDPAMAGIERAIGFMLDAQMPFPSLVVNREWEIVRSNPAFDRLVLVLGSDIWQQVGDDGRRSLLRLTLHPAGMRRFARNWAELGSHMLHRARRDAVLARPAFKTLLTELTAGLEPATVAAADRTVLLPLLPLVVSAGGLTLSLFTVISTFGTAQDVTADELRIETFFPADAASEAVLRAA